MFPIREMLLSNNVLPGISKRPITKGFKHFTISSSIPPAVIDIPETNFTIEPDSEEFNVFIYDPYVTQDFPAPSSGNRKLGRS